MKMEKLIKFESTIEIDNIRLTEEQQKRCYINHFERKKR